VTFEGVSFRRAENTIDFSHFNFGHRSNFSGCVFSHLMDERDSARFYQASFGDWTNFTGADFGRSVNFSKAVFGEYVRFTGSRFFDANFSGATFGPAADFSGAIFLDRIEFCDAEFNGTAIFVGTTFGLKVDFSRTVFRGIARFDAMSEQELFEYVRGVTSTWPKERKDKYLEQWSEIKIARPNSFLESSFFGSRFHKEASFSEREFTQLTNFTGVVFGQPPNFGGCKGTSDIDLYGAKIRFSGFLGKYEIPNWTLASAVALRLRALRTLADETKNHDLERDLYIEERKAERGILLAQYWREGWRTLFSPRFYSHCIGITVMAAYWALADFGRAYLRPLVWLAASVFLFYWAYSAVLIPPSHTGSPGNFDRAVWAFAISNAVPFVGALTLERDVKLTLLCGDRPTDAQQAAQMNRPVCVPIPGRRFQLLSLAQSIFSALCIFFAGLALRNYFKLR
jgi:pentapeptide repeat protein